MRLIGKLLALPFMLVTGILYAPYKIERGGRPFPAARRKFF